MFLLLLLLLALLLASYFSVLLFFYFTLSLIQRCKGKWTCSLPLVSSWCIKMCETVAQWSHAGTNVQPLVIKSHLSLCPQAFTPLQHTSCSVLPPGQPYCTALIPPCYQHDPNQYCILHCITPDL